MADLSDLETAIRARGRELVDTATRSVETATVLAAPIASGALRDSIHTEQFDDGDTIGTDITADAPQAEWTDQGTNGPYVITAKNAKVLAFPGAGGETVFRRFVTHPGIKAQHWFADPMAGRWTDALEQAAS